MKIYNEITLEWNEDTKRYDNVVSEDSYEYDGELELAQQADKGLARFLMGTGIMKHNIGVDKALEALKETGAETKNWWDSASGLIDTLSTVLSVGSMFMPQLKALSLPLKALAATGIKAGTKVAGSAIADWIKPDVDVPEKIKQLQTGTEDEPAIGIGDWAKIGEGYEDIGQQSRGAGLRMRQGALMGMPGDFVNNLMQSYMMSKLFPSEVAGAAQEGVQPMTSLGGVTPDGAKFGTTRTALGGGPAPLSLPAPAPEGFGGIFPSGPSLGEWSGMKAGMLGSSIPAFQLPSPPGLGMLSAPSLGFPRSMPFQQQMQLSPIPQLAPMPAWQVPMMLPSEFPELEDTTMGYPAG